MKYTEEHEWLRADGDIYVVGITEHATTQLGDLVFVELPEVGTVVTKDDEIERLHEELIDKLRRVVELEFDLETHEVHYTNYGT